MNAKYEIVKAKIKDFSRSYNIILECSEWLKSRGIYQWYPVYPEKLHRQDVSDGNVYFFIKGKTTYGTVTLARKPPFYYPARLKRSNNNEIYICRLAIPRRFSGKDIGKKLMDEIEKLCNLKNIKKMRLDIVKNSKFLKDYYTNEGFNIIEEFIPPKIGKKKFKPAILMEKQL
tara:strand:- start:17029 stop:17547 length:519 start_codon:yes stop_codon:yes gene_type:complete